VSRGCATNGARRRGRAEALARLVPADPLDVEARSRLLEIGRREGATSGWQKCSPAPPIVDTPGMKGEILMQVASIYEDLIRIWRVPSRLIAVLVLDESDAELVLPAARALERIMHCGDQNESWPKRSRSRSEARARRRCSQQLLGRLGELCQSVLGDAESDRPGARVPREPGDELALAALDACTKNLALARSGDGDRRRREVSEDTQLKRKLMVRSAQILASKLSNVSEAIDAWRAVMDEFGPEAEVLLALEALYRSAERWDELAETYDAHLDLVDSDAERLELLANLGDLRREHLSDVSAALESYRRALTLDAAHERSRAALEQILRSDDQPARREAAEFCIRFTKPGRARSSCTCSESRSKPPTILARLDSLERR
jgi:tetratricopeptide (TPR) repeat protein